MRQRPRLQPLTAIQRLIGFAKENFRPVWQSKQITLLEGDAVDVLSTLTESYDFVFMDSAKSKYIVFLPEILKHLDVEVWLSWMIFSKVVMLLRILWKSVVVSELFTEDFKDYLMQP